jgi:hypothetical protein
MLERFRFARYALKFERAFKTDRWDEVKACFHPDATYTVLGTETEWDTTVRGPDAIAAFFKKMLDEGDRQFDSRRPGLTGLPRVKGGELVVPWKATYRMGEEAIVLHGESRCRFSGGKIIALSDRMRADETQRWIAMARSKSAATG